MEGAQRHRLRRPDVERGASALERCHHPARDGGAATIPSSPNSHALRNRSGPISPCSNGATKMPSGRRAAAYLETPFSGHRARHEALDYFAGYAAVTGPTVVIPDQRTAITIRPRHHGLVGHVCPHAIKPDFVVTSRLVLCLPVTRFGVRRV